MSLPPSPASFRPNLGTFSDRSLTLDALPVDPPYARPAARALPTQTLPQPQIAVLRAPSRTNDVPRSSLTVRRCPSPCLSIAKGTPSPPFRPASPYGRTAASTFPATPYRGAPCGRPLRRSTICSPRGACPPYPNTPSTTNRCSSRPFASFLGQMTFPAVPPQFPFSIPLRGQRISFTPHSAQHPKTKDCLRCPYAYAMI